MASKIVCAADEPSFDSILALAADLHDQHRHMMVSYAPIVQQIISGHSRDIREIEHALYRLLDRACISEGLELFKALFPHFFNLTQINTTCYVNSYREMWHNEADQELESKG